MRLEQSLGAIRWSVVSIILGIAFLLVFPLPVMAFQANSSIGSLDSVTQLKDATQSFQIILDTLWVVFASILVFLMQAGFAMLEAGFCRAKNTVSILAKNLIVFSIATLAFWSVGFGFMYGFGGNWQDSQAIDNGLIGLHGFFLQGADNSTALNGSYFGAYKSLSWSNIPIQVKFFFQLTFAGTAATIVSGAVAERIKFFAFCLFTFFLVGFVYPIAGHWIWGGGWISKLGFYDFAGSTVIHSVGGWAAFTGVIILGPRIGKYKDGHSLGLPGHSLSLSTLGCLILWLSWFGFNPGSLMAAEPKAIGHIILTTNLSAASGMIAATIASWKHFGKPDLSVIINGLLAGLVSITASCRYVNLETSVIIGLLAGVLIVYIVDVFDFFRIDDPVGAISVHLVCGIWGTLAVGLFAVGPGNQIGAHFVPYELGPQTGLIMGGGFRGLQQLLVQIVGIASVGLFSIIYTWLGWTTIKSYLGVRVSSQAEQKGLDISEFGMRAYNDFLIRGQPSSKRKNL